MNFLKMAVFVALSFSAWTAQSACSQFAAKDVSVERFTDVGGDQVRWEQGTLFLNRGFIPTTSGDYDMTGFDLTPAILAQINGQAIMNLSLWVGLEGTPIPGGNYFCNFSRSAATYPVREVPNVIVSAKAATVKTPKVSISAVDPSCTETAGDTCQFMVVLNAPTTRSIRVKFAITGKATQGKDYARLPRSLLIPGGNVSGIIELVPIDDTKPEGTEAVKLKLLPHSSYKAKRGFATVQILDND